MKRKRRNKKAQRMAFNVKITGSPSKESMLKMFNDMFSNIERART